MRVTCIPRFFPTAMRPNLVRQRAPFKCMGYIRSRISAAEITHVFGVNSPSANLSARSCHIIFGTRQILNDPVSELLLELDTTVAGTYCQIDAVMIVGSTYGNIVSYLIWVNIIMGTLCFIRTGVLGSDVPWLDCPAPMRPPITLVITVTE